MNDEQNVQSSSDAVRRTLEARARLQKQMIDILIDSAVESAKDEDKIVFSVVKRSYGTSEMLLSVLDVIKERMNKSGMEAAREAASAYDAQLDVVEALTKATIDELNT